MSYVNAFYLALLQGLTEFLPVSSSGHLVILQNIIGLKNVPVIFDLVLHLGTTTAVIIFYRREIYYILRDLFEYLINISNYKDRKVIVERGNLKILLYIIISTFITGVIGFLFADKITSFFYKPKSVSIFLLITSIILFMTKLVKSNDKRIIKVNYSLPIIVGFAQSFAMLPGISRSGSTISASLYLGINRGDAGSFSFLIAIPSILGASLFEYIKSSSMISDFNTNIFIFAFIISFIVGLFSLKLLVAFLKRGKLYIFAIYCAVAGILSLIFV